MAYNIPKLTKEEMQVIQADEAVRKMADLSSVLVDINQDLGFALSSLGTARVEVEKLKADKSTVIELMRVLKAIAQNG